MRSFSPEEARQFCAAWLPAWTGNDAERLAAFYAEDAFYLDPTVPQGVQGKPALILYFRKLLGNNPAWYGNTCRAFPWKMDFSINGRCRFRLEIA
jgi:hypothetical protein